MKLSLLTVLALLLACSSSCAQEFTKADGAWAQNRALWESKHIKDYDMVVERLQGGTYSYVPYLISVRDGKVANKTPARPNTGLEVVDSYEAVETVDKMFDTIRRGCEDRTEMKVEYDLVTGPR